MEMSTRRRMGTEKSAEATNARAKDPSEARTTKKLKKSEQGKCRSYFIRSCHIFKWILLVVVIPPTLNYASLMRESTYLLSQQSLLFDIGFGQKLMMKCVGDKPPTVLLDSPTGMSSDIWGSLQKELSKTTRTCVYDRAGLGFSERPPSRPSLEGEDRKPSAHSQPFTVEKMADDLRKLITVVSSQPPPYIIVGSELGALVGRFYTQLYGENVTSLILIDPISEELFRSPPWVDHVKHKMGKLQMEQLVAALGLKRLGFITGLSKLPDYWNEMEDLNLTARLMHFSTHPRHVMSALNEYDGLFNSTQQIKVINQIKPFSSSTNVTVIWRKLYQQDASLLNSEWKRVQSSIINSLYLPLDRSEINQSPFRTRQELLISDKGVKYLTQTILRAIKQTRRTLALQQGIM